MYDEPNAKSVRNGRHVQEVQIMLPEENVPQSNRERDRREGSVTEPSQVPVRSAKPLQNGPTHYRSPSEPLSDCLSAEDQALLFQDPGSCDRCRVLNKVFYDLTRRHTSIRQSLLYEKNQNVELNRILTMYKQKGGNRDGSDSFEIKLLQANLDLLQAKVSALQEENVQLRNKNGKLEEEKDDLRDLLKKAYDRGHLGTDETSSEQSAVNVIHAKSLDEFSTTAFRDSMYTTSSTISTLSPNRGSDTLYPHSDQVGVYSHNHRVPVWSEATPPPNQTDDYARKRQLSLPTEPSVYPEERMNLPRLSQGNGQVSLSQEDYFQSDTLARSSKPPSTTMIGGSSNYLSSGKNGPQSPSPPPELSNRMSTGRRTLPLNYSSKKTRANDFKRSKSYRDPRHVPRNASLTDIQPITSYGQLSRDSSPKNSASHASVDSQGSTSKLKSTSKGNRKGNNGKSILLCFSKPLTTD